MSTITTRDGTEIYFKDWGKGQPIVFSHGWPLTADAWDPQMVFLASRGYRCIAHDRRGHGRSSQPWDGNEMDTYADDLASLAEALDLREAVHVGHSTGGGEVARYLGRHGTKRVAKAVLIGAVPPLMLKTAANPGGLPIEVFDGIRAGVLSDRSQFFKDLTVPFYGANRPGAKVSEATRWTASSRQGEGHERHQELDRRSTRKGVRGDFAVTGGTSIRPGSSNPFNAPIGLMCREASCGSGCRAHWSASCCRCGRAGQNDIAPSEAEPTRVAGRFEAKLR